METITIKKDDYDKLKKTVDDLWEERDELESQNATLKQENRKFKDMMKRVEVEMEILQSSTM